MSWDVAIVKIKGPFRPIAEADDADYASIGSHDAVVRAIRAEFPTAEWSKDKTHAAFDGGEFSIEFGADRSDDDGCRCTMAGLMIGRTLSRGRLRAWNAGHSEL